MLFWTIESYYRKKTHWGKQTPPSYQHKQNPKERLQRLWVLTSKCRYSSPRNSTYEWNFFWVSGSPRTAASLCWNSVWHLQQTTFLLLKSQTESMGDILWCCTPYICLLTLTFIYQAGHRVKVWPHSLECWFKKNKVKIKLNKIKVLQK